MIDKNMISIIKIFIITCLLVFTNQGSICSQNTWIQKAPLPASGRFSATTFVIGGNVYLCCGDTLNTGIDYINDMWEWDQISNSWTQKANFPGTARRNCIGFSIGTNGYVGGGGTNSQPDLQDFYEYNSINNSWIQKSNIPGNYQMGAKAVAIGQYGYVVFADASSTFYKYDHILDIWNIVNTIPFNYRFGSTAFSIGNNAYVGTGAWEKDMWQFNSITEMWMQVADFPGGKRQGMVSFSIGNFGYVGTGFDTNGFVHSDIYAYNETNNLWNSIANYPGGLLTDAVGFAINGKGYILTGTPPLPPPLNSLWEYSPLVGIDEININFQISIYPNPFVNQIFLNIKNNNSKIDHQIVIYGMDGKYIMQKNIKAIFDVIDVSLLASGTYIYKITNNSRKVIHTGKLIKF